VLVKTIGKSDYFPAVCLSLVIDSRIDSPGSRLDLVRDYPN